MQIIIRKRVCLLLLGFLSITIPCYASSLTNSKLAQYFQNWGEWFGYDVTTNPGGNQPSSQTSSTKTGTFPQPNPGPTTPAFNANLLNPTAVQNIFSSLFPAWLGALLIVDNIGPNTEPTAAAIIPCTSTSQQNLNTFINNTFNSANSNICAGNSSSSSQAVTINPLIDQQPYQGDPVSQQILNILSTPDVSYCINKSTTPATIDNNCQYMNQNKVMMNVIGTIPTTNPSASSKVSNLSYLSSAFNMPLLPQLNSNSLISPLLYTQTSNTKTTQTEGLVSTTPEENALNFIRYASATVIPPTLPSQQAYDGVYQQASQTADPLKQMKAQTSIANYLLSLRTYAAQYSVPIGNLYYIMSKRMPQGGTNGTSQALDEFNMATWRIFNPSATTTTTQWLTQINTASSATVQKEIAGLLAEINYQLYLNRQQEERLLLTQTIQVLMQIQTGAPSAQNITSPPPQ